VKQFLLFFLIILSLASCKRVKNSDVQLTLRQDSVGKVLLNKAQEDIDKKQSATFNILTESLPLNRYVVDTTHSSIQFRVKHWGIYDVIGRLESYEIVVHYDREDFKDMVVEARISPVSINMPNQGMANHLKVDKLGFFEIEKYPTILFKSTKMEILSDSIFKLIGNMTIKEITKEMVLEMKLNGYAYPPNKSMPGFTVYGKFNRLDYKLGGTELLPGNGLPMIGNEIFITSNIRLISDYD
jgi:polyisoprenoid-binding protein YceI